MHSWPSLPSTRSRVTCCEHRLWPGQVHVHGRCHIARPIARQGQMTNNHALIRYAAPYLLAVYLMAVRVLALVSRSVIPASAPRSLSGSFQLAGDVPALPGLHPDHLVDQQTVLSWSAVPELWRCSGRSCFHRSTRNTCAPLRRAYGTSSRDPSASGHSGSTLV